MDASNTTKDCRPEIQQQAFSEAFGTILWYVHFNRYLEGASSLLVVSHWWRETVCKWHKESSGLELYCAFVNSIRSTRQVERLQRTLKEGRINDKRMKIHSYEFESWWRHLAVPWVRQQPYHLIIKPEDVLLKYDQTKVGLSVGRNGLLGETQSLVITVMTPTVDAAKVPYVKNLLLLLIKKRRDEADNLFFVDMQFHVSREEARREVRHTMTEGFLLTEPYVDSLANTITDLMQTMVLSKCQSSLGQN